MRFFMLPHLRSGFFQFLNLLFLFLGQLSLGINALQFRFKRLMLLINLFSVIRDGYFIFRGFAKISTKNRTNIRAWDCFVAFTPRNDKRSSSPLPRFTLSPFRRSEAATYSPIVHALEAVQSASDARPEG